MNRWRAFLLLLMVVLAGSCVAARMAIAPRTGLSAGRLLPCPGPPNCVCSQDPRPTLQIAPLAFHGTPNAAFARLIALVKAQTRAQIMEEQPGYLWVEFRSLIFRFVDDVEFLMDAPSHVIQVRSASRIGHSDLGVNRRRVEALRREFAATAGDTQDPP